MKRLLLPVLIGALAISQLFAQQQESTATKHYITEISPSAQYLLDAAGLLKDGKPTPSRNEQRDMEFRLDSTVTFDSYTVGDSTRRSKTWNLYPNENNIVNIHFAHDGENWFISGRTTTFYDAQDRIRDVIYYTYDAGNITYREESRLQVFPHELSTTLIDSFVVSTWREGTGWSPELTTQNAFDPSDNIIESVSEFIFFDDTLTIIDRFTYQENRLDRVETYTMLEEELIHGGTTLYQYEGNIVETITSYVVNGPNDLLPESKEVIHYTHDHQVELVNHYIYDFEKQDWKFYQADGYQYDEQGRTKIYEVGTLDENGILHRVMTAYVYVQQLHVKFETNAIYDSFVEGWRIQDRTWYYYTELVANDPVWHGAQELIVYPNPTQDFVTLALSENVQAYLYDLNGRLMVTETLTPSESNINLQHLPSGAYQLITQAKDEVRTATIIRL